MRATDRRTSLPCVHATLSACSAAITSEVMVQPRTRTYLRDMHTSSKVAALVLAGFGAFSVWVVASHGYFGFLTLAAHDRWALQMLLDLVIACSFAIGWMRGD